MKQMVAEAAYVSVKHFRIYHFLLFSGSMTTDRNAFDANIDFLNRGRASLVNGERLKFNYPCLSGRKAVPKLNRN